MSIFEFMANNPWQTFCLGPFALMLFGLTLAAGEIIVTRVIKLISKLIDALNIWFRGYPPSH